MCEPECEPECEPPAWIRLATTEPVGERFRSPQQRSMGCHNVSPVRNAAISTVRPVLPPSATTCHGHVMAPETGTFNNPIIATTCQGTRGHNNSYKQRVCFNNCHRLPSRVTPHAPLSKSSEAMPNTAPSAGSKWVRSEQHALNLP